MSRNSGNTGTYSVPGLEFRCARFDDEWQCCDREDEHAQQTNILDGSRRCRRDAGRFADLRTVLSRPPDQADRAVPAWRADGCDGAHGRPRAQCRAQAARDRGEPRWRRWRARLEGGRDCRARWLYALVGSSGTLSILPALNPNLDYDPKAFVPVALVSLLPHVLVVPTAVPA